ncbi:hypothetical protein HDU93_010076 [Gonapodya sp. JEL0774]|nr:hypothetical protein HDU93_010076 [Gonapodya sp. JEL0774]
MVGFPAYKIVTLASSQNSPFNSGKSNGSVTLDAAVTVPTSTMAVGTFPTMDQVSEMAEEVPNPGDWRGVLVEPFRPAIVQYDGGIVGRGHVLTYAALAASLQLSSFSSLSSGSSFDTPVPHAIFTALPFSTAAGMVAGVLGPLSRNNNVKCSCCGVFVSLPMVRAPPTTGDGRMTTFGINPSQNFEPSIAYDDPYVPQGDFCYIRSVFSLFILAIDAVPVVHYSSGGNIPRSHINRRAVASLGIKASSADLFLPSSSVLSLTTPSSTPRHSQPSTQSPPHLIFVATPSNLPIPSNLVENTTTAWPGIEVSVAVAPSVAPAVLVAVPTSTSVSETCALPKPAPPQRHVLVDLEARLGEDKQIHVRTPTAVTGLLYNESGTIALHVGEEHAFSGKMEWVRTGVHGRVHEGTLFWEQRTEAIFLISTVPTSASELERYFLLNPLVTTCRVSFDPENPDKPIVYVTTLSQEPRKRVNQVIGAVLEWVEENPFGPAGTSWAGYLRKVEGVRVVVESAEDDILSLDNMRTKL